MSPNEERPRPRRFDLLRSFSPADFITMGNAACGTVSLFLCLMYLEDGHHRPWLWLALGLLPLALVLDMADGWVARKTHRKSPYGGDLDSLADTVSFGVAPAVLAFSLGMRGVWDMLILAYFVCCGISRLARYNVTAESLADGGDKVKYYEGTPIPTSLALVALLGLAFALDATGAALWGGSLKILGATLHPLVLLYALSGSLMVSGRIRIPKP